MYKKEGETERKKKILCEEDEAIQATTTKQAATAARGVAWGRRAFGDNSVSPNPNELYYWRVVCVFSFWFEIKGYLYEDVLWEPNYESLRPTAMKFH